MLTNTIGSAVANVRSAAVDMMTAQVDILANNPSKLSSISKCDDPEKTESLYCITNNVELLLKLANDVQ